MAELIPVEKTVQRGASTFAQVYWVRPEEVKKAYQQGGMKQALSLVGAEYNRVYDNAQAWAGNTLDPGSVRMRAALATMLGPEAVASEHGKCMVSAARAATIRAYPGTEQKNPETVGLHFAEGATDVEKRALKGLASVSQAQYDTPTVTLYRGFAGTAAGQINEALERDGVAEIRSSVMLAFSEDQYVASTFAKSSAFGGGVLVKMEVPREAIVMSHRVKELEMPGEKEVVVATQGKIRITKADVVSTFAEGE